MANIANSQIGWFMKVVQLLSQQGVNYLHVNTEKHNSYS
jgi:hypothetical protein